MSGNYACFVGWATRDEDLRRNFKSGECVSSCDVKAIAQVAGGGEGPAAAAVLVGLMLVSVGSREIDTIDVSPIPGAQIVNVSKKSFVFVRIEGQELIWAVGILL